LRILPTNQAFFEKLTCYFITNKIEFLHHEKYDLSINILDFNTT